MILSRQDQINFILNGSILDYSNWRIYPGKKRKTTFIFEDFEKLVLDYIQSVKLGREDLILMSGGWDSGLLLELMCRVNSDFSALSWGWGENNIEGSDAYVAMKRCERKGIRHFYINLKKDWTAERISDFFKETGGIRTDHFNSYVSAHDRKYFWDLGFRRVWRADEAFGWLYNLTRKDTRVGLALGLPGDFNFKQKKYDINWADHHQVKFPAKERDQYYYSYRLPVVIGTLSLPWQKTGFEIMTPFIEENILTYCTNMTWSERTEKKKIKLSILLKYPEVAKDVVTAASIPEPLAIWKHRMDISRLIIIQKNPGKPGRWHFFKKIIRNIRGYNLPAELIKMRLDILEEYNS